MINNILVSTLLLYRIVECVLYFNLYNTYQSDNVNNFEFDCLRHYRTDYITDGPDVGYQRFQMIEYCIRPIDANPLILDFINVRDENYTFGQLRDLGVTTGELISLSSTIDLAEKYQDFLDKKSDNSSLSSKILYLKCEEPWFGSQCQYSFEFYESNEWLMILSKAFSAKEEYGSDKNIADRTCYTNIKCDRGGTLMCLDWREICNGRIDCLNGGVDEEECFQLEINECEENEYRCHHGLCLSTEISNNEQYLTDCLDRSGTMFLNYYFSECFTDPTFICEEHACQPGRKQFPCGDGQCVEDFAPCDNGRHYLLIESMSVQGNLSEECWLALICLTKIKNSIDKKTCQKFVNSSSLFNSFQTCDSPIQFPTIPVLFGHVSFLYDQIDEEMINMKLALPPTYVCYVEQLCHFLQPTFHYKTKTCRMGYQMGFKSNVTYNTWKSLIDTIKPYFDGCLTTYKKENSIKKSSLYCCKNSSKCISKHRILDGISDCYLNDDEEQFELSCTMNNTHRFKCPNENICYSLFFPKICPSIVSPLKLSDLSFHEICDRIVHLLPETINGENHTDETECDYWPCSNVYTRCNLFWNCENGKDEENCSKSLCNFPSHPCISPHNGTFFCLSVRRIEDGIIDCLGGSDELRQCLQMKSISNDANHYHCLNEDKCLQSDKLCNNYKDCSFGDDEAFCKNIQQSCNSFIRNNRSNVETTLCQLKSLVNRYFSLENCPIYPSHKFKMINYIDNQPSKHSIMINNKLDTVNDDNNGWSWRCNRGLYARAWFGGDNYSFKCFCPPSYYGDLCEYQNERVSLSLRLMTNNYYGIYKIIVTLIDDDDDRREINSYSQIYYLPREEQCPYNYNMYLLYLNRLKNKTKKYSVHIDAYNLFSLTYLASWYLKIPFLFLPVNRLSAQLVVPTDQTLNSNKCLYPCQNGQCTKYINVEKFFCRCNPGWSGISCNFRTNCADCSLDSICIGSLRERSICVCPVNKFGSRCLLKHKCPLDFCKNNGQCLVTDATSMINSYNCICPESFYGNRCEMQDKYKLEISLNNIETTNYAIIHYISVRKNQAPYQRWIMKTLKMFQNVIILSHNGNWNIVIVKTNNHYYLAAVQLIESANFSTSISSNQRCSSINEVLKPEIIFMPQIRRVKYYHIICQSHPHLWCFFDESYMCLCTRDRHANCFHFQHNELSKMHSCRFNFHCLNGGECLVDVPDCPRKTLCNCKDCYFGNRCQYYAKGIGLTLNDILRYEIRPDVSLMNQSLPIKITLALTIIMFVLGLINSSLSLLVFSNENCRKVGCGIYLLASSVTSCLTLSTLMLKFWFLVLTQINIYSSRIILRIECVFIENFLKFFLYYDSWLYACVAIERSVTIFKGINFNATKSKYIAKRIIILLPLLIMGTIVHDFFYRDLFDDSEEERIWCVAHYSHFFQAYNTFILFFHFLCPFFANLFSALYIICQSSRQRATIRIRQSYSEHLYEQLKEHKHLIISPICLVILSLPRLIISLLSNCVKAYRNPWLYILSYFISFIPSVLIFVVFILPSQMYKKQFQESIRSFQRQIHQRVALILRIR
ncbi:unnamed protein product [Adineta steineri]|uniref:Uncharacterized protein n=1 Tax=Adineta steineri TaxID=433720 RepID=A0A814CBS2_9BILA|nr:unnamed protein product [Adineta steineri]CAF3764245.1 unnamed protein product [Adineta steineri]